jgi:hypothetical protein
MSLGRIHSPSVELLNFINLGPVLGGRIDDDGTILEPDNQYVAGM